MNRILPLALALSLIASPVFAQNTSANIYQSRAALTGEQAELVTIVSVRQVLIQNSGPNAGTFLGGTTGSIVGYAVTSGSRNYGARSLGTVIGGATGAAVGTAVANNASTHPAIQVFVQRFDSYGRPYPQLTAVVQDDDQPGIRAGAQAMLVRDPNGLSVVPAGEGEAP